MGPKMGIARYLVAGDGIAREVRADWNWVWERWGVCRGEGERERSGEDVGREEI